MSPRSSSPSCALPCSRPPFVMPDSLSPFWHATPFSDLSGLKLIGDWSEDERHVFYNASHAKTPTSVVPFTFYGTQTRATFNGDLYDQITWSSGGRSIELTAHDNHCKNSGNYSDTTGTACPPAFYTTEVLPCDLYTLSITAMPNQTMQIKGVGYSQCTPADDNKASTFTSASTTPAPATAPPSTSVTAAEDKQNLGTGVIAGISLVAFFALGSLALFFILRRRRRGRGLRTGSPPPSSSPSPFFSRSRPWFRLFGLRSNPSTPSSARFLTSVPYLLPAPAAASGNGRGGGAGAGRTGQGYSMTTTTTTMVDAPAAKTASAAPMLPRLSTGYYASGAGEKQRARDGEGSQTAVKMEPLRSGDLGPGGMAFARGYLPDSKELMAWQEIEQASAQGSTQTPRTTETLPLYQTRGSLQSYPFHSSSEAGGVSSEKSEKQQNLSWLAL